MLSDNSAREPSFQTVEVLSDQLLTFEVTLGYGTLEDKATTTVLVKNISTSWKRLSQTRSLKIFKVLGD